MLKKMTSNRHPNGRILNNMTQSKKPFWEAAWHRLLKLEVCLRDEAAVSPPELRTYTRARTHTPNRSAPMHTRHTQDCSKQHHSYQPQTGTIQTLSTAGRMKWDSVTGWNAEQQ